MNIIKLAACAAVLFAMTPASSLAQAIQCKVGKTTLTGDTTGNNAKDVPVLVTKEGDGTGPADLVPVTLENVKVSAWWRRGTLCDLNPHSLLIMNFNDLSSTVYDMYPGNYAGPINQIVQGDIMFQCETTTGVTTPGGAASSDSQNTTMASDIPVYKGMSPEEVLEVLGNPEKIFYADGKLLKPVAKISDADFCNNTVILVYRNDTVRIYFERGEVVSMTENGVDVSLPDTPPTMTSPPVDCVDDGTVCQLPTNPAVPADPPPANSDAAELQKLREMVYSMVKASPCTTVSDCGTLPLGVKVCGDPAKEYLVFSRKSTDEAKLTQVIQYYNALETLIYKDLGDCGMALLPPELQCVAGTCTHQGAGDGVTNPR